MKFFLLSNSMDALAGLRLAGINGAIIHEKAEVLEEVEKVLSNNEIGILLITEQLAEMIPEKIAEIRLGRNIPIITVIPDRHEKRRKSDYITNYIKESIGLKF